MEADTELDRRETIWLRGAASSLLGTAVLTGDRLIFIHTNLANSGASGILDELVANALQIGATSRPVPPSTSTSPR